MLRVLMGRRTDVRPCRSVQLKFVKDTADQPIRPLKRGTRTPKPETEPSLTKQMQGITKVKMNL
jgi:hypothetical protein